MLYELRHYIACSGKAQAVRDRFTNHVLPLFDRHGFRLVGIWQEMDPEQAGFFYVLAWQDDDEKAAKWESFRGDPDWQRAKAESERRGPIVEAITSRMAVSLTESR